MTTTTPPTRTVTKIHRIYRWPCLERCSRGGFAVYGQRWGRRRKHVSCDDWVISRLWQCDSVPLRMGYGLQYIQPHAHTHTQTVRPWIRVSVCCVHVLVVRRALYTHIVAINRTTRHKFRSGIGLVLDAISTTLACAQYSWLHTPVRRYSATASTPSTRRTHMHTHTTPECAI